MKSVLIALGVVGLAMTPTTSVLTEISNSSQHMQNEGNFKHFWNIRENNEVKLNSWQVYDTEEFYESIFSQDFNLTTETNNQLKTIEQLNDINLTTDPDSIPWLGFPASFITISRAGGYEEFLDNDINSVMNQMKKSSLSEKISGNLSDDSEKGLYQGAQYTIGTWDIVNADNVAIQAGMKVGLTVDFNEQKDLILTIWGSLFVQSAPAEYWLGGLAFIPIGSSIEVAYNY